MAKRQQYAPEEIEEIAQKLRKKASLPDEPLGAVASSPNGASKRKPERGSTEIGGSGLSQAVCAGRSLRPASHSPEARGANLPNTRASVAISSASS